MKVQQESLALAVKGIHLAGFKGRIVLYLVLMIPTFILFFFLANTILPMRPVGEITLLDKVYAWSILIAATILPFILWELKVRYFRKKNNLPIYENIEEELKQRAVQIQVAREQKALNKLKKDDISYWHNLLQKGAITQEEYNTKKQQLL